MPVRKYRRADDVPSNAVIESAGPASGLRAAMSLSALALRLAGRRRPSGVYKCRSLEQAQALHEGSAEPTWDSSAR